MPGKDAGKIVAGGGGAREEKRAKDDHEGDAQDGKGQAQGADGEEAQVERGPGEALDDEVGGGADDGAEAAQDDGEGHGHEELGEGDLGADGPHLEHGDADGDDGGVVGPGREKGDGGEHAEEGGAERAGAAEHVADDPVEEPHLLERGGNDEHGPDGDDGVVGKAGQGLGQSEHAADEEDGVGGEKGERHVPELDDERGDGHDESVEHLGEK